MVEASSADIAHWKARCHHVDVALRWEVAPRLSPNPSGCHPLHPSPLPCLPQVRALLVEAAQRGYSVMVLDTLERLEGANRLYCRLGFEVGMFRRCSASPLILIPCSGVLLIALPDSKASVLLCLRSPLSATTTARCRGCSTLHGGWTAARRLHPAAASAAARTPRRQQQRQTDSPNGSAALAFQHPCSDLP